MKIKTSEDFINFCETAKRADLITKGFRIWDIDEEKKQALYLIPDKFYDLIPEGFEIISSSGTPERFSKETHNKDGGFGLLAYGFFVPIKIIKTTIIKQKK